MSVISPATRELMTQAARNRPRSHYEKVSAALREDPDQCFDRRVMSEPNSGCSLWLGPLNQKGYGMFTYRVGLGQRKTMMAHRYAWIRERGPIPAGLELDHLCRTRSCVNVTHLEPVTHAENVRRGELGATTLRRLQALRSN